NYSVIKKFEELLPLTVFRYAAVRDFERFSCQNSLEPNMRLDTNIKQIVKESNRRFGGAYFLQKTNLKRLKPLCCMMHCYRQLNIYD
ncbi:MAG: hypothetical protein KAR57_07220, partial [Bacteroidales bacterium]|nr:hypothetical protein [Bacteroidales bacterium]